MGGSTPWGISDLPPSTPVFPSTIMGTHTSTTSLYVQPGSCPHPRSHPHHLPPGGLSVDVVSMRGKGPLVRSWGSLGLLWGVSGPFPAFFLYATTRTFYFFFSS